jgi:hypothetical protein
MPVTFVSAGGWFGMSFRDPIIRERRELHLIAVLREGKRRLRPRGWLRWRWEIFDLSITVAVFEI